MDPASAASASCASNDSGGSTTFTLPNMSTATTSINFNESGSTGVLDGRPRRISRMHTYNETVLSGSWVRRKSGNAENRTVSGKTSMVGLKVADTDSTSPSNEGQPGGVALVAEVEATANGDAESGTSTRRWTRAGVLAKASGVIERTKSILGKRRRDPVDVEKGRDEPLKADPIDCLGQGSKSEPSLESPMPKRARFAATSNLEKVSPLPNTGRRINRPAKAKRWLKQGLYVGQDRDFNPKLTEAKNKLKKKPPTTLIRESKPPILPLPMFAGLRSLELGRTFRLPFDVFSPLPPGQPKPNEWRKTRTNVFVGEAANVWKKSKRLESSACLCTPEGGCGEDCLNRFMLYECDDTNCALGPELCSNRSFAQLRIRYLGGGPYYIGVEVMKTLDRGYGVRSNRTFARNQIIVEYTGEIITQDECDKRMNEQYKDNECYYLMSFEQNMIVDATRGSIARFVNHSCEPNCRMVKWVVAGKPRMALFAGDKGIMTGEELTYDYNFDPFSIKNVQECRCGAVTCRGVLGPKPKEVREAKDALRPVAGGKHKIQRQLPQTLQPALQPSTHKKPKPAIHPSGQHTFADEPTKARVLASSGTTSTRGPKVSKRSLKGGKRTSVTETLGSKGRRRTVVTYSKRTSSVPARMQDRPTDGAATKRGHNVLLSVHARARARTSNGTFAKKEMSGESPRDVAQDLLDLAAAVASDSSLSPEPEPLVTAERPIRKTANPVFSSHARAPPRLSKGSKSKGNGEDASAHSTSAKRSAHARARPRAPSGVFASSQKKVGKSRSSTVVSNQSSVDQNVTRTATRYGIDHDLLPYTHTADDTFALTAAAASSKSNMTAAAPTSQVVNATRPTPSRRRFSVGSNNSCNNNANSPPSIEGGNLPSAHDPFLAHSSRAPLLSQTKSTESSAVTPITTPATTPSATGNPKLSALARYCERTSSLYFGKSPSKQTSPSASIEIPNSAVNPKLSAHVKVRVRSPSGNFAKRKRSDESPSRSGNPKLSAHARKRQRGPGGVFLSGRTKAELAKTKAVNPKSIIARRKRRSSAGTFLSVDANGQPVKQDPSPDSSSSEEEPVGGTESILQATSRVSDSIRNAMNILRGSSKHPKTEEVMHVAKE